MCRPEAQQDENDVSGWSAHFHKQKTDRKCVSAFCKIVRISRIVRHTMEFLFPAWCGVVCLTNYPLTATWADRHLLLSERSFLQRILLCPCFLHKRESHRRGFFPVPWF